MSSNQMLKDNLKQAKRIIGQMEQDVADAKKRLAEVKEECFWEWMERNRLAVELNTVKISNKRKFIQGFILGVFCACLSVIAIAIIF